MMNESEKKVLGFNIEVELFYSISLIDGLWNIKVLQYVEKDQLLLKQQVFVRK